MINKTQVNIASLMDSLINSCPSSKSPRNTKYNKAAMTSPRFDGKSEEILRLEIKHNSIYERNKMGNIGSSMKNQISRMSIENKMNDK